MINMNSMSKEGTETVQRYRSMILASSANKQHGILTQRYNEKQFIK